MQHPEGVSQWLEDLARAMPVLAPAQRRVLAQWCFAMEETGLCACHTLAVFLSLVLGEAWHTTRQRLREWYFDAADKPGRLRQEVDVRVCFAPLARWVLAHWSGTQVAVALDATTLGDRLVLLAVSIVYKGCAVPIAWKILPAGQKHAWKPEWLALLTLVQPAFPPELQVLVLTDRGLYARWLYRAIVAAGWHPFMRVNVQGTFHPSFQSRRQHLATLVPRRGTTWAGAGVAFTGADRRLSCTVLACWDADAEEPWCILTDFAPTAASVRWYALRVWVEHGFRTHKRGFWQWQHTRMTDPARAERLWLPMALCTFRLLAIGDALEQDTTLPLWGTTTPPRRQLRGTRLVRLGWLALRAAQTCARPAPQCTVLSPSPWPGQAPPSHTYP